MKKTVSAIICAVLLLLAAGCSAKPTEKEINTYIGEGQMMIIKNLLYTNEELYGKVFISSHLPLVPERKMIKGGKEYAVVESDLYGSFADIEACVRATYTADAADKLLSEHDFYADMGDLLCFDISREFESQPAPEWDIEKMKTVSASDAECVFSIDYTGSDGKKSTAEVRVVCESGEWHLDNLYPVSAN